MISKSVCYTDAQVAWSAGDGQIQTGRVLSTVFWPIVRVRDSSGQVVELDAAAAANGLRLAMREDFGS